MQNIPLQPSINFFRRNLNIRLCFPVLFFLGLVRDSFSYLRLLCTSSIKRILMVVTPGFATHRVYFCEWPPKLLLLVTLLLLLLSYISVVGACCQKPFDGILVLVSTYIKKLITLENGSNFCVFDTFSIMFKY